MCFNFHIGADRKFGMTFEIIQSLFVVQRTYFQSILVIMLFDSPSSLQDGQITQQGFRDAKKCTLLSIHLLYIENSHTQKYPHRNIRSSYNTLGFPHVCTLVCGLFSSQNPSFISSPFSLSLSTSYLSFKSTLQFIDLLSMPVSSLYITRLFCFLASLHFDLGSGTMLYPLFNFCIQQCSWCFSHG